MAPDPKMTDEALSEERQNSFRYITRRDYRSLADSIKKNSDLARLHGQSLVIAMGLAINVDRMSPDEEPFYGHQLTGDQLQVLAYARRAGAPIGERDITVHFDYVAKIKRKGREYQAWFPDLVGTDIDGRTLTETERRVKEVLASYIGVKMLHGDTLPEPKYYWRKTKNVRPFRVQLTLADLVFADDQAAKNEQARGDFATRTELARIKAR